MTELRLSDYAKIKNQNPNDLKKMLLGNEKYLYKKSNRFMITDEGQEYLTQFLQSEEVNESLAPEEKTSKEDDLIKTIQDTIVQKDKQIEALQDRLKEAQNLLNQQQQLTLKDKNLLETINNTPTLVSPQSDNGLESKLLECQEEIVEYKKKVAQLENENRNLEEINA